MGIVSCNKHGDQFLVLVHKSSTHKLEQIEKVEDWACLRFLLDGFPIWLVHIDKENSNKIGSLDQENDRLNFVDDAKGWCLKCFELSFGDSYTNLKFTVEEYIV